VQFAKYGTVLALSSLSVVRSLSLSLSLCLSLPRSVCVYMCSLSLSSIFVVSHYLAFLYVLFDCLSVSLSVFLNPRISLSLSLCSLSRLFFCVSLDACVCAFRMLFFIFMCGFVLSLSIAVLCLSLVSVSFCLLLVALSPASPTCSERIDSFADSHCTFCM